MQPQSDVHILFGLLAVQLDFMSRSDLVTAIQHWVDDKNRPLADVLRDDNRLTSGEIAAVNAVLVEHLKKHANNAADCLKALSGASTLASWLTPIDDPDVQASVAKLELPATEDYKPSPREGRYRKLHSQDNGGQGVIWVVEDMELHREVALKEIKPHFADDEESRKRLIAEAQVTAKLEHPGIVPIHDQGRYSSGRPFYIMRFLTGGPLGDEIHKFHADDARPDRAPGERRLALSRLLRRFIDVCHAVAYAHSRGVIHRDLKPKNVMIGKFGETLVIDWGMTKTGVELRPAESPTDEPPVALSADSGPDETVPGALKGTIPYMSPEQALRRPDLTKASDIYSLGAILYEILTGRRAYTSTEKDPEKKRLEILAKVQKGQFPPPREANPHTPAPLAAICETAMAFAMKDRYQSALDLAADVERWLADERVQRHRESWLESLGRWSRRHQKTVAGTVASLAAILVMAVVAFAAVTVEQRETEKQRQVAVKNYDMSRRQALDVIRLIETSEGEIASSPALSDRRKEMYATASDACRDLLLQQPDDVDLQQQTAQVYRFRANFHRVMNEIDQAARFYHDSLTLREKLCKEQPDAAAHELIVGDTEREYAHLEMLQGNLDEAARRFARAVDLNEKSRGDGKNPIYLRRKALGIGNLAIIDYRQATPEKLPLVLKKIGEAEGIFAGLLAGKAEKRHPYDDAFMAATLNIKAIIERDMNELTVAEKTHAQAVLLLENLPKKSKRVNAADLMHFSAHCRMEQAKTWAKIGTATKLIKAEKNVTAVIVNLGILAREFGSIPAYQETIAEATVSRGEIRIALSRQEPAALAQALKMEKTKEKQKTSSEILRDARADFENARANYTRFLEANPKLSELQWGLAQAYAGLGRVAQLLKDQDPQVHFRRAETERAKAAQMSPRDARIARPFQPSE